MFSRIKLLIMITKVFVINAICLFSMKMEDEAAGKMAMRKRKEVTY